MNDTNFVIEEYTEWLHKAIKSVKDLLDKTKDIKEKERLKEKYYTLKMTLEKFEELKKQSN